MITPPTGAVRAVIGALEARGAVAAVGGSGLLAGLGLVDEVHDWDVTTDATPALVTEALAATGLPFAPAPTGDGPYATVAHLRVDGGDHEVDVIVGFAVHHDGVVVALPVTVSGRWRDLPLADPATWARAYRLIGRPERADLLDDWLDGVAGGR